VQIDFATSSGSRAQGLLGPAFTKSYTNSNGRGEYWVGRESVSNPDQYVRTLMQSSSHDEVRQKKFGLTSRELEIVSAVVAGYSNKEIRKSPNISRSVNIQ